VPIRKNLAVTHDPYSPWMGPKEAAVCRGCGAVYHRKHWALEAPTSWTRGRTIRRVTCPACRKKRDDYSGGIIRLGGGFLKPHKEEILHLIRNQERRATTVNPLERIILVKDHGNFVEIRTTSDRFAQRIGKEVQRAYKGEVTYQWSRDDKFLRVKWRRGGERKPDNPK
jgi:NMD protein affecting ribosome stability and mRNA decay